MFSLLFYFKFVIKRDSFEIAILPVKKIFFVSLGFFGFFKINILVYGVESSTYSRHTHYL